MAHRHRTQHAISSTPAASDAPGSASASHGVHPAATALAIAAPSPPAPGHGMAISSTPAASGAPGSASASHGVFPAATSPAIAAPSPPAHGRGMVLSGMSYVSALAANAPAFAPLYPAHQEYMLPFGSHCNPEVPAGGGGFCGGSNGGGCGGDGGGGGGGGDGVCDGGNGDSDGGGGVGGGGFGVGEKDRGFGDAGAGLPDGGGGVGGNGVGDRDSTLVVAGSGSAEGTAAGKGWAASDLNELGTGSTEANGLERARQQLTRRFRRSGASIEVASTLAGTVHSFHWSCLGLRGMQAKEKTALEFTLVATDEFEHKSFAVWESMGDRDIERSDVAFQEFVRDAEMKSRRRTLPLVNAQLQANPVSSPDSAAPTGHGMTDPTMPAPITVPTV